MIEFLFERTKKQIYDNINYFKKEVINERRKLIPHLKEAKNKELQCLPVIQ